MLLFLLGTVYTTSFKCNLSLNYLKITYIILLFFLHYLILKKYLVYLPKIKILISFFPNNLLKILENKNPIYFDDKI